MSGVCINAAEIIYTVFCRFLLVADDWRHYSLIIFFCKDCRPELKHVVESAVLVPVCCGPVPYYALILSKYAGFTLRSHGESDKILVSIFSAVFECAELLCLSLFYVTYSAVQKS